MRLGGLISTLALAGCTLDFDGVGPGASGSGGSSGSGVAGGPSAGQGQGGNPPTSGGGNVGAGEVGGANAGGAASCDETNGECVEQPVGFSGIIELREGIACATPPVLTGGLPSTPITAPVAACGCACELNDEVCGDLQVWSGTTCNNLNAAVLADPSGCTVLPLPGGQSPQSVSIELGMQPGASCKSNGLPSTKEPMSFNEAVNACAIETSLACGATEVCLPEDGGSYCLVAAGATTCPAGPFANEKRLLSLTDFADSRVCTCGCGATTGQVTCTAPPGIALHSSNDCTGSNFALIQFAGCFAADDPASISFTPEINGSCAAATPMTDGDVVPIAGAGQLLCCNTP